MPTSTRPQRQPWNLSMDTINLFGASGHAKVVMDIIEAQGDCIGVLFDDAPQCNDIHGKKVCKTSDNIISEPLIISIGANIVRKKISIKYAKIRYAKALHPNATISRHATISEGTVIMQGVIIQSDSQIGRHCIINTGATIDHECVIGDFVHVSPNATLCGNVHVGEGAWIGAGATVIPGIKIGKWSVIGAGSVVICDIPDGAIAFGNPCKVKRFNMQNTDNQQLIMGGGNFTHFSSQAA